MQRLIDDFMETLGSSGLGQMAAIGVVITVIMVFWKVQDYICKKLGD